ncbi:unnamed protein product [Adineta ricciae]|uniref:Uncharacterized protein n=1 Tax=Adineta ricciae TaxID=249248 RepID=A0A813RCP6_ADIRI|nr:unnamed protein product [Adineta ricciae]CAF1100533.1 unnamed protein product [Adineta ricciae]
MISAISNANEQCDENIFVLISSRTVFLYDGNPPSVIYETKPNTTIEQGLFHRRTNTILLLLNEFNTTYSVTSLNTLDTLHTYWNEKLSNKVYSSTIHLSLGQRYLYLFDPRTSLIQTFTLPLSASVFKQNDLLNLPKTERALSFLIDENFRNAWILYQTNHFHQLHVCQLETSSCQLLVNIYNLISPIKMFISWKSEQFYIHSQNYLMIFEYNHNQTDYSMHYLNLSRANQFLTLCESTNRIEYISTNQRDVCYETCEQLPWISDDTSDIHTIQRLPTLSNIFYCSKQRRISKIVLLVLILIDLLVLAGVVVWSAYKHIFSPPMTKQLSCGTISTIEKDFITYF